MSTSKIAIIHKETLHVESIYVENDIIKRALLIDFPETIYVHMNIPDDFTINNICVTQTNGEYIITKTDVYAKNLLRQKRNELLIESDWTQLPDTDLTPEQKQEWILYRKALRDLPSSTIDVYNPIWPTKPSLSTPTATS